MVHVDNEALIARIGKPVACRILPSIHRPSPLARTLLQRLQESFAPEVAPCVIRDHETLREAASFGQPVVDFAPDSDAEQDFTSLVEWLEGIHVEKPIVEVQAAPTNRAAELARRVASRPTPPESFPEPTITEEHDSNSAVIGKITPSEDIDVTKF